MMKYIKLGMVLCAFMVLLTNTVWAQTSTTFNLEAVILDEERLPVEGARVRSALDSVEAVSDNSGFFSLDVSPNSTLTVTADGYVTQFHKADMDLKEIVLEPYVDNIVNVAYRSVDKD